VRGYFVAFTPAIPPQRVTDPSPVPLRLVKAPAARHPLPKEEGNGRRGWFRGQPYPSPRVMIRPLSADCREAAITSMTWHVSSGGQRRGGWRSVRQRAK